MGADTKGYIKQEIDVTTLKQIIEKKLKVKVEMKSAFLGDLYTIDFTYKNENRNLNISIENSGEKKEIGQYKVILILGAWGRSVEIIQKILEEFGGYLQEKDTVEEYWFVAPKGEIIPLSEEQQLETLLFKSMKKYKLSFKEKTNLIRYIKENKEFLRTLLGKEA